MGTAFLWHDAEALGNPTKDVSGTHGHHPWRGRSEILAKGTGKDLKGEISHQGCPSLCQDQMEETLQSLFNHLLQEMQRDMQIIEKLPKNLIMSPVLLQLL